MPLGRRSILAVIALVVAAFLLVPGLLAERVEHQFRTLAAAASENQAMELRITEYQRGWFGAEARSELRLELAEEMLTLPLSHTINHGPTLPRLQAARIDTRLDEDGTRAFTLEAGIGLTGTTRMRLDVPAFEGPLDEQANVHISHDGASLRLDIGRAQEHYELKGELGRLTLTEGEAAKLELRELGLTSSGRLEHTGELPFWSGESVLTLSRATLDGEAHPETSEVRDLELGARQSSQDGQVELGHTARFAGLKLANLEAGSGHYGIRLSGLNRRAWDQFQSRVNAVHDQGLSVEATEAMVARALLETLPEFLAGQPRLDLDEFELETSDGPVSANLQLRMSEPPHDAQAARVDAQLQRLSGTARLALPQEILRQFIAFNLMNEVRASAGGAVPEQRMGNVVAEMARQQVRQLQGMGVFETLEDERLESRVTLNNGVIQVNGTDWSRLY